MVSTEYLAWLEDRYQNNQITIYQLLEDKASLKRRHAALQLVLAVTYVITFAFVSMAIFWR